MDIKTYQWIKGEKLGKIEHAVDFGNEWVTFQSGNRVSSTLLNEFLIPIFSEAEALDFKTQDVLPNQNPVINNKTEEKPKRSPIYELIQNIKNKEEQTVHLKLNFTLPKREMINILLLSYDESEVLETLKDYVLAQVNENTLKAEINKNIVDFLGENLTANTL